MKRPEIIELLKAANNSFVAPVEQINKSQFEHKASDTAWSVGQEFVHILKSTKALAKAVSYPRFLIRWKFGKANRPSRTYDELIKRYNERISQGVNAPSTYTAEVVLFESREQLVSSLNKYFDQLCRSVKKSSEKDLDKYILPHPALGFLTLREMMYFTHYHTLHHLKGIERRLSSQNGSNV